jgi:hypothetical protein
MKAVREWMADRRVAAVLVALAVLLVAYRVIPRSTANVTSGSPPAASSSVPSSAAQDTVAAATPSDAPMPAAPRVPRGGEIAWSWGRNPFLPTGGERVAGGDAVGGFAAVAPGDRPTDLPAGLRGTVVSGGTGIAVFGNRLVPVGGRIGEWTVERVAPYGVSLRRGKETRTVELFKPPPSGGRGKGGER